MIGKASVGDASGLEWFKSSYSSSSEGDDCVEVALEWRKSSYSSSNESGDCVEVASTPSTIHLRDSKLTDGPHLTLAPDTWSAFIAYASNH
ncbi:DUF397 domain-containing protein [Streptomyces kanamyceticus]|uniref:DUF397 domain-containing protein n=1 Tax=Streptomyces kanamyceticus TaxID=1967 RepID=A0A5J6GI29_STRKN|nr:DUF397 domain-containing protein [Streptomyces kanamyceticus]QEU94082.1 DUF397 domain-containing protein [Streptomyces kanamyceticus]